MKHFDYLSYFYLLFLTFSFTCNHISYLFLIIFIKRFIWCYVFRPLLYNIKKKIINNLSLLFRLAQLKQIASDWTGTYFYLIDPSLSSLHRYNCTITPCTLKTFALTTFTNIWGFSFFFFKFTFLIFSLKKRNSCWWVIKRLWCNCRGSWKISNLSIQQCNRYIFRRPWITLRGFIEYSDFIKKPQRNIIGQSFKLIIHLKCRRLQYIKSGYEYLWYWRQ